MAGTGRLGAWPLAAAWVGGLALVVAMGLQDRAETEAFYGVAESRERVVNADIPVEIRRIHVVEGQSVEKGQLLVELASPELDLRINGIAHQLEALTLQQDMGAADLKARIARLEAERHSRTTEMDNEIRQLEARRRLNRELAGSLRGLETGSEEAASERSQDALALRIAHLKKERDAALAPLDIEIRQYRDSLRASAGPMAVEAERLRRELEMLTTESGGLVIHAEIAGIIGSIHFKPGEKAAPFAPILTLHPQTPSFVKGYLFESASFPVAVGDSLRVAAVSGAASGLTGTVVGVGARIVEYPLRLRRHPEDRMWGREVLIRITEDNSFILGEKVRIAVIRDTPDWLDLALDWFSPRSGLAEGLRKAVFSSSSFSRPRPILAETHPPLEASGILLVPEWGGYAVISDETPESAPCLHILSVQGEALGEIPIEGLGPVSDLESITRDASGHVLVAASLSENKKGRRKPGRGVLARLRMEGDVCRVSGRLDLYGLLERAAEAFPKEAWAGFFRRGVAARSLDMEGMTVSGERLFLAFKTPLNEKGEAVILEVAGMEELFAGREILENQVKVWRTLRFSGDDRAESERISDMQQIGGRFFFTTVSPRDRDGKRSGSVWRLDAGAREPVRIARYAGLAAEGLCAAMEAGRLAVVFDQGGQAPSRFALLELAP